MIGNEPPDERMVVAYVISPEQTAAGALRLEGDAATPISDLVLGLRPKIFGEDEEAASP